MLEAWNLSFLSCRRFWARLLHLKHALVLSLIFYVLSSPNVCFFMLFKTEMFYSLGLSESDHWNCERSP